MVTLISPLVTFRSVRIFHFPENRYFQKPKSRTGYRRGLKQKQGGRRKQGYYSSHTSQLSSSDTSGVITERNLYGEWNFPETYAIFNAKNVWENY